MRTDHANPLTSSRDSFPASECSYTSALQVGQCRAWWQSRTRSRRHNIFWCRCCAGRPQLSQWPVTLFRALRSPYRVSPNHKIINSSEIRWSHTPLKCITSVSHPKPHDAVRSARGQRLRRPFSTPSSGQGRCLWLRNAGFTGLNSLWRWGIFADLTWGSRPDCRALSCTPQR
jgi:hypothetical protein